MGKTHIADPRFEQDPENGTVHIEGDVAGALLDEQLRATALFEDVMPCSLRSLDIVETQVVARESESVRPGTAALDDGTTADAIESYFGLWSVILGDEVVVFF